MKEAEKIDLSKTEVINALDLGDKKRKKSNVSFSLSHW